MSRDVAAVDEEEGEDGGNQHSETEYRTQQLQGIPSQGSNEPCSDNGWMRRWKLGSDEVAEEDEEEMGDKPQVSTQLYRDDRRVTLHLVAKAFSC